MKSNITAKIEPWMQAAIDKYGQGESIGWETALMPGQQGEPMFLVFIWFPGAVLGYTLNGSFHIADVLGVTEAFIDEAMRQGLEALRQARSSQIQQQAPTAAPAPARGSQTASGLLIP